MCLLVVELFDTDTSHVLSQFHLHQQASEIAWPLGMVDECEMDIDVDITAEVQCMMSACVSNSTRAACTHYHSVMPYDN